MDNGILQTLKGLNRDLSALSASSCLPTKDELCAIEDQLQSALLTVRSTKNVVISAINRLPQDVLLLIPTYFDPEAPKSVLNASHVCRLWRSVFLSSPALWGIVDSTEMSTSLMHLYLERSGESPLDVTLETMTTTECIQQQLLDRSHRIRSLSFETTYSSQWNKFLQPFSVSALPALTDLWILADTSVDPTAFEPTIFSRAPNLRHFTFNILGPSIPIGPRATFPNLTTISVESRDIDFPLKLLDHLFDLLQSSLSLTDIDLKLHTPRVDPIVLHRRITLPSLQNLSLCCSPTLAIVLASITLPPAGVVSRIEIRGGAFPHDLMRSIVQTLSTFIAGSDELIFSRSRVYVMYTVRFKMNGETRLELVHCGKDHPFPLKEFFNIIAGCPLDTVRRFVIGGRIGEQMTSDRSYPTMLSLKNVGNLVLEGTVSFLPLLSHTTEDGKYPFPVLKTLEIHDNKIPHEVLVPVLKARTEAGLPLQRITLRTKAPKVTKDKLLQFVEDVEFGR